MASRRPPLLWSMGDGLFGDDVMGVESSSNFNLSDGGQKMNDGEHEFVCLDSTPYHFYAKPTLVWFYIQILLRHENIDLWRNRRTGIWHSANPTRVLCARHLVVNSHHDETWIAAPLQCLCERTCRYKSCPSITMGHIFKLRVRSHGSAFLCFIPMSVWNLAFSVHLATGMTHFTGGLTSSVKIQGNSYGIISLYSVSRCSGCTNSGLVSILGGDMRWKMFLTHFIVLYPHWLPELRIDLFKTGVDTNAFILF
jgi:hypothetical protein